MFVYIQNYVYILCYINVSYTLLYNSYLDFNKYDYLWSRYNSATRNTMEISYAISTFYVQACELFVSRRYHRIRGYLHNISVNTLWQQINNTHLK